MDTPQLPSFFVYLLNGFVGLIPIIFVIFAYLIIKGDEEKEEITKRKSLQKRSLKAVQKFLKEKSALRAKKVADEYKSVSSGTA